MHLTQRPELNPSSAYPGSRPPCSQASRRCQIMARKGFLSRRHVTRDLVLLVHSHDFQLGVLIHVPVRSEDSAATAQTQTRNEDQAFTHSALAMISAEFHSLGLRKRDLTVHLVGGSAAGGALAETVLMIRRTLRSHGLSVTANDLGGNLTRSIWLDVESGRVIIRSELAASQPAGASDITHAEPDANSEASSALPVAS